MQIGVDALDFVGSGLNRPECVVAHASGRLFVPDWTGNGGIAVVSPAGDVRRILVNDVKGEPLRPNGIALEPGGTVLMAHLGAERGGLFRLHPDGRVDTVLDAVGGRPLPPCNFPLLDARGRIWLTVSTRKVPRALGYRPGEGDGFVVLVEGGSARIVADGLGYTNECALSPDGGTLFVNETFARRLSAFTVAGDGGLGGRRTVATFGRGTFPDGLAMDEDGGLWVTSIVSNRVIRVGGDGALETVIEDSDEQHLDAVEMAFAEGTMGRPHLDVARGRRLRNVSNLAFGGDGMRTAFLGCLLGDAVARFDAGIAGAKPVHWNYDMTGWFERQEGTPCPA
ncbi:MAG: SMP-30/gluconolactonase/LRE family protein [Flavobacteriaceae bacterium]